jgi:DNA-binding transcriptional LysR family regulator
MNIDNKNIDLNLFRTFFMVAELGSISKAAERLFVSQPSISYSIKSLESALDVKLFNRTGKGVELTTEGKNLKFYVESAYNSICIGERAINFKLNSQMVGELSIGVPAHIGVFYLSKFLLNFHNKYPNMKIHISNRPTSKLVELLELHKLDLRVDSTPIVGRSKDFVVNHLTSFECCFAVNKNNEIAKETKAFNYKELSELPLMLPGESTNTRNAIDNYFLKGNITVDPVIEVSTTEMMIDFVKRNMGVGYFVEEAIEEQLEKGLFVKLNLKNQLPKQEIACAYIEDYLTIGAKKFIALLEEYGINANNSDDEKPA